jgi:hypothetical protein
VDTLSRDERARILQRLEQIRLEKYGGSPSTESLRTYRAEERELTGRYLEGLPRFVVACCPSCDVPVLMTIDAFGLDGLWWHVFGPDLPPDACPHYRVTLGALHLLGNTPDEASRRATFEIECGPEVPYVVPRLTNAPDARVVLHSLPIAGERYRAYLMSYFADPPTPPSEGHQPWLRREFLYRDGGRELRKHCTDPWDFDLGPWLQRDPPVLAWLDANGHPQSPPNQECPYLDLPGRRKSLLIRGGHVIERAPP